VNKADLGRFQSLDTTIQQLFFRLTVHRDRAFEDLDDIFRDIVGCDPVNGHFLTVDALVDQHQLAIFHLPIFLASFLQSQADRHHQRFTSRQAVAGLVQIQVPGPQAVGTVVAVIDAR